MAYLAGELRLSVRQTQRALLALFGVRMSTGSVVLRRREASRSVASAVEEAAEHVRSARVRYADETTHPVGNADGKNDEGRWGWLWAAATPGVAVFDVELSRATQVARRLLGDESTGIVVTDRYGAYSWLEDERHQFCWSHLLRTFRAMAEREGASRPIGEALVELGRKLFRIWHRYRGGGSGARAFGASVARVRREVRTWLERGARVQCGPGERTLESQTRATCRHLLRHEQSLWVFTWEPGVEPTSNHIERLLRHAVLWRRVSQGSESAEGARFVARMLTVVMSLRLQGRDVLDYLREAVAQARADRPAPSLLPAL